MKGSGGELALGISRAVISASKKQSKGKHYSWSANVEQTLHNLSLGWHQNLTLTPSLVASVIDPFLLNHHSLALGFFHWASQQPGFTHTSTTFHSILKSLSLTTHHSHHHALLSLFKRAQSLNFPIHPSVFRSVITSHLSRNNPRRAFSLFNDVVPITPEIGGPTCNSLLASLASNGYLDSARKVFGEMTVRGIPLSTLGFGVFVWRVCEEEGNNLGEVLDDVLERECGSGINGSVIINCDSDPSINFIFLSV